MQAREIASQVFQQQYEQHVATLTRQLFEARAQNAALDAEHVEALRQLAEARKELAALKVGDDPEPVANSASPEPGTE